MCVCIYIYIYIYVYIYIYIYVCVTYTHAHRTHVPGAGAGRGAHRRLVGGRGGARGLRRDGLRTWGASRTPLPLLRPPGGPRAEFPGALRISTSSAPPEREDLDPRRGGRAGSLAEKPAATRPMFRNWCLYCFNIYRKCSELVFCIVPGAVGGLCAACPRRPPCRCRAPTAPRPRPWPCSPQPVFARVYIYIYIYIYICFTLYIYIYMYVCIHA